MWRAHGNSPANVVMILHFSHQIEDEKEPLPVRPLLKEIPTVSNTLNLNTL